MPPLPLGIDVTHLDLPTEVVRTERLVLRPYRPDDVEAVHRASQDPETQRWISGIPVPYTVEAAHHFVTEMAMRERTDGTGLSVVIEADGEFAGTGGLHFRPGRLGPEIGYSVAPWARGRRYASETTAALAEWAFRHGAHRVHLFVDVDNSASQRVARRAGFAPEGVVRACLDQRGGGQRDAVLFSRLPAG